MFSNTKKIEKLKYKLKLAINNKEPMHKSTGTIQSKSNSNIVYSCKYHIVWCPKYRRKVLVGEVETRLKQIINECCFGIKC